MERAQQGQLRRWIDGGFEGNSPDMFFVVSILPYSSETDSRDIANIISCSNGMGEYILKISVDYVERNSVVIA